MDPERRAKIQSIRIIVSEILMVLAVICTVSILAFVVSGYWINSDFKVERQGMIQISSIPTGADVAIDGDSAWMQRTNMSKVLPSGEHTVTLSKDGYDSWSRTVNISEGLLYRLDYPRLFLKDRKKETVYNVENIAFNAVSPNHEKILLGNNTTEWTLLDLTKDVLEPKSIDVSKVFVGDNSGTKSLFDGHIVSAVWDLNNEHVLLQNRASDGSVEWALVNTKNQKADVNITKEFNINFSRIEIFDSSASTLLAVANGNLYKIDLAGGQLSTVLAQNVYDFAFHGGDIVFSATSEDGHYFVGLIKDSDDQIEELATVEILPKVLLSRFYDKKYITTIDEQQIAVYELDGFQEIIKEATGFVPEKTRVGLNGSIITTSNGGSIVAVDMEAMSATAWQIGVSNFGWLDDAMVYASIDGILTVCDFDGLNCREIAKNVSTHLPVIITKNDRMYYVNDGSLVREWLIPR